MRSERSRGQAGADLPRLTIRGGSARSSAVLLCGNSNFGYRHIANEHKQGWTNLAAAYTGDDWRGLADFAIRQILDPS